MRDGPEEIEFEHAEYLIAKAFLQIVQADDNEKLTIKALSAASGLPPGLVDTIVTEYWELQKVSGGNIMYTQAMAERIIAKTQMRLKHPRAGNHLSIHGNSGPVQASGGDNSGDFNVTYGAALDQLAKVISATSGLQPQEKKEADGFLSGLTASLKKAGGAILGKAIETGTTHLLE